jgi:phosphoglycolate phosphatase-like HAD superfamily hydrolase
MMRRMNDSGENGNERPGIAWLFDVDGTLLTTDGAATESFVCAFRDATGIVDDLAGVPFAGRTEPLILADILARHGLAFEDGDEPRFWNRVFEHATTLIVPPRGRLMPGVPAILEAVARDGRHVAGLLTGNMTQMAHIKLRRFGLTGRFAFGAFGEMAEDRNALARLAVSRIGADYGLGPERCIVIGDTEHDIACARAAGAWAVAVATGGRERETLARHAPDLLLDDLSDAGALIEWVERVTGCAK